DLAVIGQIADRIAVMYGGEIVEVGPAAEVLSRPKHPYTKGLLGAIPDHRQPARLEPIPGVVAGLGDRNTPCVFAPRCSMHQEACDAGRPRLVEVVASHSSACFRTAEVTPGTRVAVNIATGTLPTDVVLSVENLRAEHRGRGDAVVAAADVSFEVKQ